jgi:hypothetical protein
VLLFGRLQAIPDVELVAVAFILAVASYRWIETPARKTSSQRVAVFASLLVVLVGTTGMAVLPKPVPPPTTVYTMGCDDWYNSARVKPCVFGNPKATRTVVVIGDSIGLQWFPAIQKIYRAPEWRLIALTKGACPMVDAPVYYKHLGRFYTECEQWRKAALAKIVTLHPDVVILGSSDTYDYTPAQWTDGTARILRTLSPGQVRLLRSTPLHDGTTRADVYRWQMAAADGLPNVRVIDMNAAVCPQGQCAKQAYRDERHLQYVFVASLSAPLARLLRD